MRDPLVYWASQPESKEVVNSAIDRIKRYRDRLSKSGRLGRMQRSLSAYQGYGPLGNKDSSKVLQGGAAGELAEITGNQFGGLVQQCMVLITSSKPAFKVIAVNSDYDSGAQATIADGLLEYYERKLNVADKEYEATQTSVLTGEGFVFIPWDPSAGEIERIANPETPDERPVPEGDVEIESKTPFDVAYDPDIRDFDAGKWVCVKRPGVGKHDLAVKYPAIKEKLLTSQSRGLWGSETTAAASYDWEAQTDGTEQDTVEVWELHHKPTPACPNGRLVSFVNADIVLFDTISEDPDTKEVTDSGYPYDEIPLYRITPEVLTGSSAGHTAFFDLLGLQQCVDLVAMMTASAVNAGGLMKAWLPPGHNLSANEITKGLMVLESTVKPEILETLKIAPEMLTFNDMCISQMRQRVAINDVVMGDTNKGMPAQAMALLRAQAIEFHSRLQANYERLLEKVRTGVLKLLKRYAKGKRVALLAGKSKTWALKEFSAEDLSGVDRVSVEPINALARTFAGKNTLADKLQQMGAFPRPDQYMTFLATGRLDPILEGPTANMMRLTQEKELLMQGIGPQPIDPMTGQPIVDGQEHIMPLKTDTHWIDVPEVIQSVLSAPGARNNPAVVQAAFAYVDRHMQLWRANPDLAVAMGGQPAPSIAMPPMPGQMTSTGMPMPGGAAPSGTSPPMGPPGVGGQGGNDAAVLGPRSGPQAPVPQGAPPIRLPKPPPNPITGEPGESPPMGAI